MELASLKGIGNNTILKLNSLGINNVENLLTYYPYRYNYYQLSDLSNLSDNSMITITGKIITKPVIFYFKHSKSRLTFQIISQGKIFNIVLFNRSFLKNHLDINKSVTIIGTYKLLNNQLIVSEIVLESFEFLNKIQPVYHLINGISNKNLTKYINNNLDKIAVIPDYIPEYLSNRYKFFSKEKAIINIHQPDNDEELKQSIIRAKYEELFNFLSKIYLLKQSNKQLPGIKRNVSKDIINEFIKTLPFLLTNDQLTTIEDIYEDMMLPRLMNRLIQGDVGSGKTIIAFISIYLNYLSQYQSAFMVPTEVLAQQHYDNAVNLFKNIDIKITLLTGSTTLKQKKEIYEQLETGEIDLIIGTHTLFQDKLTYHNLGLIITDEQHRFGVNQRYKMKNKGKNPDILYMSATPIPRTYALTIYGDMDISSIKTKPKNRQEVKTFLYEYNDALEYLKIMYQELINNHQVYIVAPLIDDDSEADLENVYSLEEKINKAFKNKFNVGILHGKLNELEKKEILDKFKDNKINILISTTVIEVGVDVYNATVMCIFNAEKFGLSQLHQLRGRVGRNEFTSYCLLISDKKTERLKILTETADGFEISEADFKLRGQGEIFGNKQSGDVNFKLVNIKKDFKLLNQVKKDVQELFENELYTNEKNKYIDLIDFNNVIS